jgi:hypothetical protein
MTADSSSNKGFYGECVYRQLLLSIDLKRSMAMVSARISLTLVCFLALLAATMTAQPEFSDWSAPRNLGPVVNSNANDGGPALSKDGKSLYFASNRLGQFGGNDIWVSQWDDETQSWGLPSNLGPVINTTATEFSPNLSRDGHWFFFHSNRPGSSVPGLDIWASYREHVQDDFGWQPPVNLGAGVNGPGLDIGPSFFENEDIGIPQLFFASNRPGGPGGADIYVSQLQSDGIWGAARLVPELSSSLPESSVSVRFDGLEAFIARPGPFGAFDLWVSVRKSVFDPWSTPAVLGALVNSSGSDQDPHIAPDRESLYFSSNRAGGYGGSDLYVVTRTRHKP